MQIHRYVKRIWRIRVTPDFLYKVEDQEKKRYSWTCNIMQENNCRITTRTDRGRLPIFSYNVALGIPIYAIINRWCKLILMCINLTHKIVSFSSLISNLSFKHCSVYYYKYMCYTRYPVLYNLDYFFPYNILIVHVLQSSMIYQHGGF